MEPAVTAGLVKAGNQSVVEPVVQSIRGSNRANAHNRVAEREFLQTARDFNSTLEGINGTVLTS